MWGNSMVIMLTPTDVKDLELTLHHEADIEDVIFIKKKVKKKRRKKK